MSFRPPDSPYYYAEYIDEHGDRRRVSTKSRTKREADAVEAELRVKAERVRLGLEVRERNARHWTIAEAVEWWLREVASKQKNGKRVGYVVRAHLIADLGALTLEEATPATMTRWLASKREKLSPTSCNRLRAYTMGIFSRLIEHEHWRGENPMRRVRPFKQQRRIPRTMPAAVVRPLLREAPTSEWRKATALAAYAGLRRGEIAALKRADVDVDARIITVRDTKTSVERQVAIHRELLPFLVGDDELVIPALDWNSSAAIVRRALVRAELAAVGNFHGLRGTWASTLIHCGASPDIVEFMGWGPRASSVMRLHYVRHPAEVLRREIDKLEYP